MSKLPELPYAGKYGKATQVKFGGLRHHRNCTDGEFFDMENLTCEEYPILSAREVRGTIQSPAVSGATQIYADNGVLLAVNALGLSYNGLLLVSEVADYQNTQFVRFGDRVVMMPDKKVLNLKYKIKGCAALNNMPENPALYDAYAVVDVDDHYSIYVWDGTQWADNGRFDEPMEARLSMPSVIFSDGSLYGAAATANCIILQISAEALKEIYRLRAGDAVRISGCTTVPSNNKVAIIREISDEGYHTIPGCTLHFSDFCFTLPDGSEEPGNYGEAGDIKLERLVPEMDVLFEHENRLWGAKGKEIFASKLGDPFNWYTFDAASTDSWYLQTQGKGEITAGMSLQYPRFFREDCMTTVYGTTAAAFQTQDTPLPGVKAGEKNSLAAVGQTAIWLSREGLMLYNGEGLYRTDDVFGDWKLKNVCACADSTRYYAKATLGINPEIEPSEPGRFIQAIFCYDAALGIWTKENDLDVISMSYDRGVIYALTAGGEIHLLRGKEFSGSREPDEASVSSFAEFGDFTDESTNKKSVNRLLLRFGLEAGAEVAVKIRYDSTGDWKTIATLTRQAIKKTRIVPITPRRCDHYRLRIEGRGKWRLYAMTKSVRTGTERG